MFGVYVTVPSGLMVTVPLVPSVTALTESASPSTSLASDSTSMVALASSSMSPAASPTITGASFTGSMVKLTVAAVTEPWPSSTR